MKEDSEEERARREVEQNGVLPEGIAVIIALGAGGLISTPFYNELGPIFTFLLAGFGFFISNFFVHKLRETQIIAQEKAYERLRRIQNRRRLEEQNSNQEDLWKQQKNQDVIRDAIIPNTEILKQPQAEVNVVQPIDILPSIELSEDIEARDEYERTPLHLAVQDDDWPKIKKLIDAGADIEARDDEGNTPLYHSI